ncbi:hypothetical protein FA048_02220 [Pedobacter polaris]|uniref:Putative auto-transporter adhesin head GIN domain-containing protein n=1 Tax=Pedobacter polaris TaxID=2571273 RepID=A0A4U1CUD7_9SPHI|nr:DUF2807 domain-containing protein [Pedobacter polaris]TKC12454.1 hypothetical protein FA048_02220 [Pedobacter polaris]
MKTSIKNLFAATLTLVVLTSSAFASTDVKQNNVTVLNQVKNTNKVVVNGNVEVILVQAPVESVKVYDSYYSKNALVQQQEGVLRISSFQKETLTVVVYVRNLSTIEAGDNSSVKTSGKMNFLSLDVILNGNSKADINANTVNLTTSVKDSASLKLGGSTTDFYATLGTQAKINMDQFTADCLSLNSISPVYAKATTVKKPTLESIVLTDELAK